MHIHALIIYSLFGDENYVYKQQKNYIYIYVYRQRLEGSQRAEDGWCQLQPLRWLAYSSHRRMWHNLFFHFFYRDNSGIMLG